MSKATPTRTWIPHTIECEIEGCDDTRTLYNVNKHTKHLCDKHYKQYRKDTDRVKNRNAYRAKRARQGLPVGIRSRLDGSDLEMSLYMLIHATNFPTGGVFPYDDILETAKAGYWSPDSIWLNLKKNSFYKLVPDLEAEQIDPDYVPQKLVEMSDTDAMMPLAQESRVRYQRDIEVLEGKL